MELTTTGRYRVIGRPRSDDELLCIDVSEADAAMEAVADATRRRDPELVDTGDYFDPTYLPTEGYEGAAAALIEGLEPGNLVDLTLRWTDGTPRVVEGTVVDRTRFHFEAVERSFDAAREAWYEADAEDLGVLGRVTSDADGEPNGVVYVFAKQTGARDVFEEFADGVLPLEPLVRRVDYGIAGESDDGGPREVFVLDPAREPFVAVLVALELGGPLAETVRESFGVDD
jgi:hypothetical protein